MGKRVDGWMDGWMDGWVNGWVDGLHMVLYDAAHKLGWVGEKI